MQHEMKLKPQPFSQIISGRKTVELRLQDEKRLLIHTGDTITFTNAVIPSLNVTVLVTSLHPYASFEDLFKEIPPASCGFEDLTASQAVTAMRSYYSEEAEKRLGVLGIGIKPVSRESDWTKDLTCKNTDIPQFIRRMELMKAGKSSICPFCGGSVTVRTDDAGHSIFACDRCDMTIETQTKEIF